MGIKQGNSPEHIQKLIEANDRLQSKDVFNVGDLVEWKPNLRSRKYPQSGTLGIVTKVYEEPIRLNDKDSGTPYFNEPLDLVIGVLDDGGDLLEFHNDSRRFQRYQAN